MGYQPPSWHDPNQPPPAQGAPSDAELPLSAYPPMPPVPDGSGQPLYPAGPMPGSTAPSSYPPPPYALYGHYVGYAPAASSQPSYPAPPPYPMQQPGYFPPAAPSQPLYPPPPAAASQPLYPPPPGYMAPMGFPPYQPARPQSTGPATAGLILGILSIPAGLALAGCGIVFGALALTFSIMGMRLRPRPGIAVAGLILSIIGLLLSVGNTIAYTISSLLTH